MITNTWTPEKGADLKRRREAAGVSKYRIAKSLGRPYGHVASWESGARSPRPYELTEIDRIMSDPAPARPTVSTRSWQGSDRFDGTRLRALRVAAGYGTPTFARLLGTDRSRVKRWEKGHIAPGKYYAERICEVLHVDPEQLCRPVGE